MTKPKVYIHRLGSWYSLYMNEENEAALKSFAEVVSEGSRETPLSAAELIKRMKGCTAILSHNGLGTDEITVDVLRAVGTIELICLSHWCEQLVDTAREAGIPITEGSNANTVAVAEWTVTAALMGIRQLHTFDALLKTGSPWAEPRHRAGLLCQCTVGLIGLGRIGWYVAHYFKALGARVIAYDKYCTNDKAQSLGVQLVPLKDLLSTADVISLHLPHTDETRGLLGAKEFALIKGGAVFINSARGELTNEEALVVELQKNRFTGYLDVYLSEPLPLDHPFRKMSNVIITPHIAGDNAAMFARCAREAIQTLKDYFSGKGLRNLQYHYP
jgi:D-3-phosphoglycerate dehydrogenase